MSIVEQVNELVELHFSINPRTPSKDYKRMVHRKIEQFLKKGISYAELKDLIMRYPNDFRDVTRILEEGESKDNLLEKGKFYFHPHLQIVPPPPVVMANTDGTVTMIQEKFYLKIKRHFTFGDALQYFYERFPDIDRNERRDIAAIEYLYNKVVAPAVKSVNNERLSAVDLLLFTIDTARAICYEEDNKIQKLLDLAGYVKEALLVYQDKVEDCVHAGLDHPI